MNFLDLLALGECVRRRDFHGTRVSIVVSGNRALVLFDWRPAIIYQMRGALRKHDVNQQKATDSHNVGTEPLSTRSRTYYSCTVCILIPIMSHSSTFHKLAQTPSYRLAPRCNVRLVLFQNMCQQHGGLVGVEPEQCFA